MFFAVKSQLNSRQEEEMIEINRSNKYIEAALNARATRQDLISSNLANVDTPFYRSKDIHFEGMLSEQANAEFNRNFKKKLALAQTSPMHLQPKPSMPEKPVLFYRDGHMARNDANTVDLDVETSELSKNGVMYNALTSAYQKNRAIFSAVIEASKNVS
ncbi:MAG: flagellar basal body rod protein FlgB [Helicobacteraceae bacterium]|jgi:flagellar basal-body rod protein FlgB|nr:flagellar basal body rod protein FlgB [Helicobacteraceae bacterium]